MSITDLEPGAIYEVTAGFCDFAGESFIPGERLTFVGSNYLPYDNGHTLRFLERTIMLEGSDPVAKDLGSYLRAAVPPPFMAAG